MREQKRRHERDKATIKSVDEQRRSTRTTGRKEVVLSIWRRARVKYRLLSYLFVATSNEIWPM
jgi:hypothetical protein